MKKIFTLSLLFVFTISFSQTFILPSTGVQSTFSGGCPVGTCAGTLLDPGGAGNYSNNINSIYQTFCPTTPGNCLQVTFSAFNTESGFDYLTIGNGPAQNSAVFIGAPANASGQIMGNLSGSVPFSYTANNSSGCLTFRFTSDFINVRAGFTASLTCVPCGAALPAGNSDACASSFICSNLGFNDVSNGPGINPTEGCGGSNCVTGENYSNWYSFTPSTSGSLTFTINPNTASDDFDYALFGPNVACGALGAPVRCSYAANTGNTGLGSGAVDVSEDVNGNGWTSPINVTAGQSYMLMVNNWTAGGAGFNILFGGTASLGVLAPAVNSTSICAGQSATLTATPSISGGTYTWSPGGANTQTISVSPGSTTSYSVVYAQGGCTSPASSLATVTVNSIPTANAGTTATLTCAAPTATLSGSGGGTYAWSGPGITGGGTTANPTVNAPGTYSLAVTASGCTSTLATVAISQNNTAPVTSASSSGSITCITNTINLTSTLAGVNYTWTAPAGSSIISGANSQNAVGQGGGTYTLTALDPSNGCSVTVTAATNVNNTAPVTSASSSGSITCVTNTINLTATLAGVNYTWTAPSGSSITSGANSQNAVGLGIGTYTLLVVNPTNGCSVTATTAANINTVAPVTSASSTGSVTCTTNTINLTSTLAGANYTWTAPSPSSITSGANSQNAVGQGLGTYTLMIQDAVNGCTNTAVTAVNQNTATPSVTVPSAQTITCASPTVTLIGSANPSSCVPVWTGGVCAGANSFTASACSSGSYTLTVTDPNNGCENSGVVDVVPSSGIPVVTTSNSGSITCSNTSVEVVASTTMTPVSYSWSGPGTVLGSATSNGTVSVGGSYQCVVTNTITGCSSTVTTIVGTNTTPPSITISPSQTLTCANPTAVISTTTSGTTYTWTGTSAVVSGQGTGAVTVNTAGDYSVTVTAANGCTNTASSHIDAGANIPSVTISATSTNSIITCASPSVTLMANVVPSGTYSYTWSPSNNTGVNEVVTNSGSYNVIVLNATTGCTATALTAYTVTGNITSPSVVANNTTMPCGSPSVTLGATSTATNVSYSWTTSGSGTLLSGSGSASPIAGSAGPYVVTVTDNTNGCTNTATVSVTTTTINAAFTANPTSGTSPLLVNFSNQTTGVGNIYSWNFADNNNNTSSLTNPDHTYNTTGTYVVTLTVTDPSGLCSSTATLSIEVFDNSSIIVPNVFTPNGDGKNDVFKITTTGIKDLNCDIFNRWGTKVANVSGVNGIWDGGNVNDGTFFFILTATGFDGKEYKQQGYINIFK